MIDADPLVHQAVAEFGRGLGLSALALDADGHAGLRLQSGLVMHVLLAGDDLLLQIDCPLAFESPDLLERALVAADIRRGGGVQLGLRGRGADQVLLVARRLPWRQGTAAALARGFEQLMAWFEAVRDAAPTAAGAPFSGLRA
jgi:type III secretion system chaperone SycN